jgi:hypothetical protein
MSRPCGVVVGGPGIHEGLAADAALPELMQEVEQVPGAAGQPTEPGDQHGVTCLSMGREISPLVGFQNPSLAGR